MDMARLEIPVSGCTCLSTAMNHISNALTEKKKKADDCTFVDVGAVRLLASLGALLLVASGGSLLAGILFLRSLARRRGSLGGGLLVCGLRRHVCGSGYWKGAKVLRGLGLRSDDGYERRQIGQRGVDGNGWRNVQR